MCFSATASFTAGSLLAAGGVFAIARYRYPRQSMALAIIPVVFGIHQIIEGVVWLGLKGVLGQQSQYIAMYSFNFIAMSFWPVFIPLSIGLYEKPKRYWLYLGLTLAGVIVSVYLFWCYTFYSELYINERCCDSIAYIYRLPYLYGIIDYFYVAIVVLPFFISTNPRIRYLLGPAFLGSFLIALYIQSGSDYPSIWCFLAAVISVCIYYALSWNRPANLAPEMKRG